MVKQPNEEMLSLHGADEESKHSCAISHDRLDLVNNRNYHESHRDGRGTGIRAVNNYGRLEQYAREPSEMSVEDGQDDLEAGRRMLRNQSRDAIRQYRSVT